MNRTPLAIAVLTLALTFSVTVEQAEAQRPTPEQQRAALERDFATPRPIAALNSVWIEELTWMEIRDAMAAGTNTVIISTGGIEQNGPYLALGKHNYVLTGACEGIARALGNTLCAPIIKFVPEGGIEEPSGAMRYPGTISLQQSTFRAVLDDVASSLKAHGFENIIFIGDSGGNQRGMAEAAAGLNVRWDDANAYFIPEFYQYADVFAYMKSELGLEEPTSDGIHDDYVITSIMTTVDPSSVRHQQRVDAGKASINGISIEDLEETVANGQKLLQFRVDQTVAAIHAAMKNR